MTFIAQRPGPRYEQREESEFRRALELFLKGVAAALARPAPLDVAFLADSAGSTTTPPAGLTEWNAAELTRTRVNLAGYSTVELTTWVTNASSTNAKVRAQYTADLTGATGWAYLDGTSAPSVAVASTGSKRDTVTLTTDARGDVLIRLVTIDGDAANNLTLGLTRVRFT